MKNQFRSLDEDEVEFLDSVLESTREREREVKKETSEMLEIWRKRREEMDKQAALGGGGGSLEDGVGVAGVDGEGSGEKWGVSSGKKRKKDRGEREGMGGLKGVKIRRASSGATAAAAGRLGQEGDARKGIDPESEAVEDAVHCGAGESRAAEEHGGASAATAKKPDNTTKTPTESTRGATAQPAEREAKTPKAPLAGMLGLDYDSDE